MKKLLWVVFLVLALVALGVALRYTFLYSSECATAECFFNNLKVCSKASFINDGTDATWSYKIIGPAPEGCEIDVTLLQSKSAGRDLAVLNGKSMTCTLASGIADYPEKNLDKCHGLLKEEMQSILIRKLHTYIIDNLGEVKSELSAF